MKKIIFILFALIAGTTFGQDRATGTATVNAEIVSPISIDNVNSLDFGRLIGNAKGGDVTIAAIEAGTRTADNDDLLASTGNSPSAAKFEVIAAKDYTYSVTLASTGELTSVGATPMPITFTSSLPGTGNAGSGSTAIPLYVGGDLTLNTNQAEGDYTGEVSVTVTYE